MVTLSFFTILTGPTTTSQLLPPTTMLRTTTTVQNIIIPPTPDKLSPPSELFPGSVTHNTVLLLWSSVKVFNKQITYNVEYRKFGSKKWKLASHSMKLNRFNVNGLEPNTKYEFSVQAIAGSQNSKRTIARITTHELKVVATTLRPVLTRKSAARNAKVLVDVKPVNWDKLNITWKVSKRDILQVIT